MPPQSYLSDHGAASSMIPSGLTSRRSFSSLRSPSLSPRTSPQKSKPLFSKELSSALTADLHRIMRLTLWLCLVLLCGLQWVKPSTTTKTIRSVSSIAAPPTIPTTVPPSDEDKRWKDQEVVHVIQTRFMQEQPSLVALGMARLEIFKTFCLPTILSQTSQDFVWIIRTDPMLNETIRQPLLDLLQPHQNILLVASNSNPEGFRGDNAVSDISPASVWSGDYETLQEYHRMAQRRLVLETRLDADDGLHTHFVENLGKAAPALLPKENSWTVWCAWSHLEWHYESPSTTKTDHGFLLGIKNSACVTSGLTMAYGRTISRNELPKGTHQFLHKVVPACSSKKRDHCLRRFSSVTPGAIRARTPTSAGMAKVVEPDGTSRYKNLEPQAKVQDRMWRGVQEIFNISPQDAVDTRNFILENVAAIATDNLAGQCTKGHSCKRGAKELLQKIKDSAKST